MKMKKTCLQSMKSSLTGSEFSTMKNSMFQSNHDCQFRGNKPINIATFSVTSNPTDQFNTFKKFIVINTVLSNTCSISMISKLTTLSMMSL